MRVTRGNFTGHARDCRNGVVSCCTRAATLAG
jgi:hypothetical protein